VFRHFPKGLPATRGILRGQLLTSKTSNINTKKISQSTFVNSLLRRKGTGSDKRDGYRLDNYDSACDSKGFVDGKVSKTVVFAGRIAEDDFKV